MFYVYFILLNNGEIYKGFTEDLKRRMPEHNLGKVTSTKNKRPLKLVHYEAYLFKEDALMREKYLKTTYGRRDIKRQLSYLFKKIKKRVRPMINIGRPVLITGRVLPRAPLNLKNS